MKLGTYMPDGERRKPIEVCRSKVMVTLSIHMFATRLSHLWCVTDFLKNKITNKEEIDYKKSLNIDGQHFHQYKNQPSRTSNI
jgi:hypothetical protein